ncbi:hypothetical protein [Paenarthrobacter sp. NPDC091669]
MEKPFTAAHAEALDLTRTAKRSGTVLTKAAQLVRLL